MTLFYQYIFQDRTDLSCYLVVFGHISMRGTNGVHLTICALILNALILNALVLNALVLNALILNALLYNALILNDLILNAFILNALTLNALSALILNTLILSALITRLEKCTGNCRLLCSFMFPFIFVIPYFDLSIISFRSLVLS